MAKNQISCANFSKPDERRDFSGHGHLDVVNLGNGTVVGHAVFEPGWKWSNDVKPIAETRSCEASHMGYVLKGRMTIRMDNGEEIHLKEGDAFTIPPGHDAWVDGNEVCEMVDFGGYGQYAVPKNKAPVSKSA